MTKPAKGPDFPPTELSSDDLKRHFPDKEEVLKHYREMLRIRRFEETAARAYTRGKISGFLHLYIGQEAIAVATAEAISPGDRVVSTYRTHGMALALGSPPGPCMAELYGKKDGLVGGIGGSMHFFDRDRGMWGGYAIVGNHIPVAAGHAFASKYTGDGKVTLCFMGDGAVGIGPVHEGMTLSGLWDLPIVFIVENNRYAMGTSVTRSSALTDFSARGAAFNIPGEQVNGMDVRAVRAATAKALEWCRAGNGPYILEMQTYRYRGHSMSDPAKYRSKEEVQKMREEHDPIEQVRARLLAGGVSEDELKKIDAAVRSIVSEAAEFATQDPEPDPSELYTDILL